MKINEVEAAVGVTKKNIRFYEEEGLLHPRRDAANGYRVYTEADVERLRKIKLLRRLDVPLAQIQQMLDGGLTLAEGMQTHAAELEQRRQSLDEAMTICRALGEQPGGLNELDVQQALAELETREERQGVKFVNVEQADRKARRYRGAVIGAGLFIALMVFMIALIVWAAGQDMPPLPLLAVLVGVPVVCIICVLVVLGQRIREIGKGEADAYRNY